MVINYYKKKWVRNFLLLEDKIMKELNLKEYSALLVV